MIDIPQVSWHDALAYLINVAVFFLGVLAFYYFITWCMKKKLERDLREAGNNAKKA